MDEIQQMLPDLKYKLLLYLSKMKSLNNASLSLLLPHTAITIMYIPYARITDEALYNISVYCPNLVELDVMGCISCSVDGLRHIANACSGLSLLDISLWRTVSAKGIYYRTLSHTFLRMVHWL
jgi:hypothetical protein